MGLLSRALRQAVGGVENAIVGGEKQLGPNLFLHHGQRQMFSGRPTRSYISSLKSGGEVRTEVAGGAGHPEVNWDLYGPASEATGREAVTVGRDAMRNVTAALKRDARVHRPSAYTFHPTSESRAKLYAAELKRAGVSYTLEKNGSDYKLVYDPGALADVVQGLASTAPLGLLGAAAMWRK